MIIVATLENNYSSGSTINRLIKNLIYKKENEKIQNE